MLAYATDKLAGVDGVQLYGTAAGKGPILSFTLEGVHPHDVGTIVDQYGVAVRVGRHCAEPLMDRFGISATVRASFALYNTRQEADALAESLRAAKEFFG